MEKRFLGFPSDVLQVLCLLRPLTAANCSYKLSLLADSAQKTTGRKRFSGLGPQWAPEPEPDEWATELSSAQNRIIVTEEKRLKRM